MKIQHLQHLRFSAWPAPPAVLFATCMLLAGCAGVPPASVEVRVPVYVPCLTAVPARPDYEFARLAPAASDGEKVLALARDWPRARKYEGELEAVIEGCR
ncbi:hypothetical protein [Janthinobacterium fluminis]|uniref:Lipoprotein n=1 Tax=Janthinobacterium fluminis TaxID=2987524 RepID=A0ABT5JUV9_9BURK|nr:hypothetical protein [Janthinobacterium fluminis]MDC8756276.1 hypothetical protein [Janthinobacterium fluminis]